MAVRVQLNHRGMAEVLRSTGVRAELHARAERVAAAARVSAPVGSGVYRGSIRVEVLEHPSRVVSRVVADVPHAMVVESRTGNLARSLDAAAAA